MNSKLQYQLIESSINFTHVKGTTIWSWKGEGDWQILSGRIIYFFLRIGRKN